jgi:mono/diheme cytochrome c family protein
MPDGNGTIGAAGYPALARDRRLVNADYAVLIVVNGFKGMPSLGSYLDDEQIAAVVNYVRTHFGNDFEDEVSPARVKVIRDAQCRPQRANWSYERNAALGHALPTPTRCSP